MKRLSTILMTLVIASGVYCQVPRIRTSAPASQTAVKGAKSSAPSAENPKPAQQPAKAAAPAPKAAKTPFQPYMAIKTNVAYDAAALLNLAFECSFSERFSAEMPVVWSFWDLEERRGVRTVALQPGVRYWFDRPGRGHAVGASADIAWYNLRWKDTRYQSGSRPLVGASINYSYTIGLGRGWSAEFLIGVGYFNTRYNTYYNISDGAAIETRQKNYFGPTRLGISLVYSL